GIVAWYKISQQCRFGIVLRRKASSLNFCLVPPQLPIVVRLEKRTIPIAQLQHWISQGSWNIEGRCSDCRPKRTYNHALASAARRAGDDTSNHDVISRSNKTTRADVA